MSKVSLQGMIAEVHYELAQRKKVYGRLDTTKPREASERALHTARMQAILATLECLAVNDVVVRPLIRKEVMIDEVLPALWMAIEKLTRHPEAQWIGAMLLDVLKRETGYDGSEQARNAPG